MDFRWIDRHFFKETNLWNRLNEFFANCFPLPVIKKKEGKHRRFKKVVPILPTSYQNQIKKKIVLLITKNILNGWISSTSIDTIEEEKKISLKNLTSHNLHSQHLT